MAFAKRTLIFLICTLYLTAYGQDDSDQAILESVSFTGLHKTKEAYILDLLDPELGSSISEAQIESYLQVLKNLPSVAQADHHIERIDNRLSITYEVTERATALPIINFGGIRGNIWFSLGVTENNFRGLGDVFLGFYQNNNGRHSGQLLYRNPRILDSDWGYSFSINKWSSVEPVFFSEGTVDYYYDNNGVGLSILRNIGLRNQVEVGGTYFVESYEKTEFQLLETPPGPFDFSLNKFLTKTEFRMNYLDYHFFYIQGHESILTYQNVLNLDDRTWFNSLQLQTKLFLRPNKKLNLAFRLRMAISTNEDSPFAPFVVDSHVNIRGVGNRIDRGTAQAILNVEARRTIYHKRYLSSQLVVFADSGTWRNPGGELKDLFNPDQFRQFVGLGFRINYQRVFGASLRVDYGIDIYNLEQRGFVIGLGQYF